jgi:competence protein ComEC
MRLSLTQLQRTLTRMPMLRVLLPLACGIVLANAYALPLLFWVGSALLLALLMLLFRSSLYAFAALLLAGGALFELSYSREELPYNQTSLMRLRVEEEPVERSYGASTKARLEAWCGPEGEWRGSSMRLNLSLDSTLKVEAGDRLLARGWLRPYASDRGYWSRLQLIRGYGGRLYLRESSLLEQQAGSPKRLLKWHEGAVERIERLPLAPESRAVVLAIACGERREIDSLLRQSYARSGASHLLAVSGVKLSYSRWVAT